MTLPDASSLDHPLTHRWVTLPDASSLDHPLTHSCDITWCLFSWPSPNAQLCDITWQSFSVLAEVKLQHLYQGSTPLPHPLIQCLPISFSLPPQCRCSTYTTLPDKVFLWNGRVPQLVEVKLQHLHQGLNPLLSLPIPVHPVLRLLFGCLPTTLRAYRAC